MIKFCKKCGVETERGASRGQCKLCVKARSAAWAARNPEKIRSAVDAYQSANPEKIRSRAAAYRDANPEQTKAALTAWRAANADKMRETSAAYRANNLEKVRACEAAYRASYPEKVRETKAAYRAANPEASRAHCQNRRARRKIAGGMLSKDIAKRLFVLQRGMCPCCSKPLGDDYHLDHIMPLSLGGANEDWNIQLLRAKCNLQKNRMHPVDFMQSRGFLL